MTRSSKILYVGTDPSRYRREVVHCPLVETRPLPLPDSVLRDLYAFTHIIFTSPNGVRILAGQLPIHHLQLFAIGRGTEEVIRQLGLVCSGVASDETQEGMIDLLKKRSLENSYLFYPRSASARAILATYLKEAQIKHQLCDLYETVFLKPNPAPYLDDFDEIVFTSPSTIHAFVALYGFLPKNKQLTCVGPITKRVLLEIESKETVCFGTKEIKDEV